MVIIDLMMRKLKEKYTMEFSEPSVISKFSKIIISSLVKTKKIFPWKRSSKAGMMTEVFF